MSEYVLRMAAAIGPEKIYRGHKVMSVDRSNSPNYKYVVRVRNMATYEEMSYGAQRVIMALPPSPLARMEGDVARDLNNQMEVKSIVNVQPVTVNLQFPTVWWSSLLNNETKGSLRVLGGEGCFSRTEFHQTPYLSKVQAIRAVYSDHSCHELFEHLNILPEPKRTNQAVMRAMKELRANFPNLNIPDPIGKICY